MLVSSVGWVFLLGCMWLFWNSLVGFLRLVMFLSRKGMSVVFFLCVIWVNILWNFCV